MATMYGNFLGYMLRSMMEPCEMNVNTNKERLIKLHEEAMKVFGGQHSFNLTYKTNNTLTEGNVNLLAENRVDIKTLVDNVDRTLRGKFFLCRSLVPPFKTAAIQCLVDDPLGVEAVRLSLYNYSCDFLNLLKLIPVGTIIAIMNPWFKTTSDGGFGLRVENPQNVVIVDDEMYRKVFPTLTWKGDVPIQYRHLNVANREKRTAEEWKEVGNESFIEKNFKAAIDAYTKGLAIEPDNIDMLLNRADTYLNLRYFHRALEDTEKVLKNDSNNIKGKYQRAKALSGLQRYKEAIRLLEESTVKTEDFLNLLKDVKKLEHQNTTGEYDIWSLYRGQEKYHEDFANFVGPLQFIKGKQSKVVATEDIKAGQLLMVDKAFAVAYPDSANVDISINLRKWEMNPPQHEMLVSDIAQKLKVEPEWRPAFYELYSGKQKVDTSIVDMAKIEDIVSVHGFSGLINSITGLSQTFVDNNSLLKEASGLWLLPSLINHSCWDGNCNWLTFGDVFLLRSFKPISKGQEILITYSNVTESLEVRMKTTKKPGFVCECTLCRLDRSEANKIHKDRRRYLKQIVNINGNYDKLRRLISQLEKLRPTKPNLYLLAPRHQLAEYYFTKQKYEQAADVWIKIYNMIKDSTLINLAPQYAIQIASSFFCMQNENEGNKWISIMYKDAVLAFGVKEVVELFKMNFIDYIGNSCLNSLADNFQAINVGDDEGNLPSLNDGLDAGNSNRLV